VQGGGRAPFLRPGPTENLRPRSALLFAFPERKEGKEERNAISVHRRQTTEKDTIGDDLGGGRGTNYLSQQQPEGDELLSRGRHLIAIAEKGGTGTDRRVQRKESKGKTERPNWGAVPPWDKGGRFSPISSLLHQHQKTEGACVTKKETKKAAERGEKEEWWRRSRYNKKVIFSRLPKKRGVRQDEREKSRKKGGQKRGKGTANPSASHKEQPAHLGGLSECPVY